MTMTIEPGESVFLDTSYAIALSAPNDQHHERALELASELEATAATLVTTRAVLVRGLDTPLRHFPKLHA